MLYYYFSTNLIALRRRAGAVGVWGPGPGSRAGKPGGGALAVLFGGLMIGPLGLNRNLGHDQGADRASAVHGHGHLGLGLQLFIHPGKTQGQRIRRLSRKGHPRNWGAVNQVRRPGGVVGLTPPIHGARRSAAVVTP